MGKDRCGRRLAWLLLAPFLLVSLLSSGVMPLRTAGGTLLLVLCTGDGPAEVLIDLASGQPVEKAPDHRGDAAGPCAWACSQMAMAALSTPVPALAAPSARRSNPPPSILSLALARATGLPPATGPPLPG